MEDITNILGSFACCILSHFSHIHCMDYGLPGSSVHGILQARILQGVAISPSGNLPNPGIKPASVTSPALASGFLTINATWEAHLFKLNCNNSQSHLEFHKKINYFFLIISLLPRSGKFSLI